MKKLFFTLLLASVLGISCSTTSQQTDEPTQWAVTFADHIMQQWPDPNQLSNKGWEYNNSIILHGIEKVYEKTEDEKYLAYIRAFVDQYVQPDGSILDLEPEANNLDKLHPGILLFTLYEKYADAKYRKAADTIRAEFDNQPRTNEDGFWHKQKYENEMWLDGIYMAQPFLVKYGVQFTEDGLSEIEEAATQVTLITTKTWNTEQGLFVHGWDANLNAAWSHPVTGQSAFAWSRGLGWLAMAMVDILETLPAEHPARAVFINAFQQILTGMKNYQDPKTGLWYQVLDRGADPANWHEISGSAMFVYSIKKAIRLGIISSEYLPLAEKGWKGVLTYVKTDQSGKPVISGVVQGMGIQDSYEGYVNKERLENSTHGLCAILMAASEMEF